MKEVLYATALDNSNSEIESALMADTDSELYNSLDLDQA